MGESVGGLWPLTVEGAAEALPWVRRAGLVAIRGYATLAVVLEEDAPSAWADELYDLTQAKPIAVDAIPTDKRHNAKVDRVALAALLSAD